MGQVVLIDGVAGPAAALEAGRRGAIAQLHVSPDDYRHEMCISSVWGSPGDDQITHLPRTVVVSIAAKDGAALKEALKANSSMTVAIHAQVDTGWRQTPILVCDLAAGTDQIDEPFILFTGHHDTWYVGAMDNGGANATMLEVSRLCAKVRNRWRRGLRVIFWSGHSQGRYSSSAWYADQNWFELDALALAHVNVDSTGGMGNTVVADTTASSELAHLAREVLQEEAGQVFTGRRMGRAGDQSFWGIGVPSIFGNMSEQPATPGEVNASAAVFGGGNRLGAGTGWWWHTPMDTRDKIDADILLRDTRIYLLTVWRLLTDEVLPLDFREHSAALARTLTEIQRAAGRSIDLEHIVALARQLDERIRLAYSNAEGADPDRFNEFLRQLSRALVPLDYTNGDRFVHDPALSQSAIPALADCERLAKLEPISAESLFLGSRLRRAANRVQKLLLEALEITDKHLSAYKAG
jgi:hypothetical protein